MNSDAVKTVERLDQVIRIQSDIIDDLFLLLMMHISAEEADALPVIKKVNSAAKLRQEIGGD